MFWLVFGLFLCAAILLLARPFYGLRAGSEANTQIRDLKAELKALDVRAKDEDMSAEDHEAARADIGKRLIAAETAAGQSVQALSRADRTLFFSLGVLIIMAAGGLYALLGAPRLSNSHVGEKPIVDLNTPVESQAQKREEALAQLNQHLAEHPDDADAWRTLGWADMQERNYEGAVAAYQKAMALTPKDSETIASLAEAMGMAAQGQITPQAKALFEKAVSLNPDDARSRFYLGLAKQQAGDKQGALDDWIKLLRQSPADAPFRPMLMQEVEKASKQLGQPVPADLQAAAPKGPSAADVKAAQEMTPEQRQQMINGMIAQLQDRLKENPKDMQGWSQLIRSLTVLKRESDAKQALEQAKAAFKGDATAQAQLQALAKANGL